MDTRVTKNKQKEQAQLEPLLFISFWKTETIVALLGDSKTKSASLTDRPFQEKEKERALELVMRRQSHRGFREAVYQPVSVVAQQLRKVRLHFSLF